MIVVRKSIFAFGFLVLMMSVGCATQPTKMTRHGLLNYERSTASMSLVKMQMSYMPLGQKVSG